MYFIIYFDNASTVKPTKDVIDNIVKTMENAWYNPSGMYSESEYSKTILELCRENIRKCIKANKEDKIIFTSSGCESNSLALDYNKYDIIYDPTSHASVLEKCKYINDNIQMIYPLKVDWSGRINTEHLFDVLMDLCSNNNKVIITICLGNNETGTIQNLEEIHNVIDRCKQISSYYMNKEDTEIILHVDATQYIADQKVDVNLLKVDLMTFSGHKLGCPSGVGCLYIRDGIELSPLVFGKQEYGLRGGTENLPFIVAMSEVLRNYDYSKIDKVKKLRDYLIRYLNNGLLTSGYLVGDSSNRLSNHVSYYFEDTDAMALALYLDVYDIKCSTGSACNTLVRTPSKVLKQLGMSDEETYQVLRFTLNENNTFEDIDYLIETINNFYKSNENKLNVDEIRGVDIEK